MMKFSTTMHMIPKMQCNDKNDIPLDCKCAGNNILQYRLIMVRAQRPDGDDRHSGGIGLLRARHVMDCPKKNMGAPMCN